MEPILNIYAVDFLRYPGDLGITVIVRASSESSALCEAWRLFPEYKRLSTNNCVHLLEYAEIDWDSGRCIVKKRQKRIAIPKILGETPYSEEGDIL